MQLDDLSLFKAKDPSDMLGQINRLPDQLSKAWRLGFSLPLPAIDQTKQIVIAGMGGSATGADMIAEYAAPACPVPIVVHRDYDLPGWVRGPEVLLIALSHSGNTEETLSAYQQAKERGCQTLAVTTGGRLADLARVNGDPLWVFEHDGQPRAAVGFSFGLPLAALFRLRLLPNPTSDLDDTLHAMRNQQTSLMAEVPVMLNSAKRMAGQLVGRWVSVFAADHLAPIARRWKGQINELAKAWAQFESLPEADHNTLAGINNPENVLTQTFALFLEGSSNNPRNQLRLDLTRQIFMTQGIGTDSIQARGNCRMAHMWTLLHFGDYMCYYLAMAYGEDPTPVEVLQALKQELNQVS